MPAVLVPAIATECRQVVWAGNGPVLLGNRDPSVTVYLGNEGFSPFSESVIVLDPLGSRGFDGSYDLWAQTQAGSAVVEVVPGGTSWAPSPAVIAAQIAASQAPGPNLWSPTHITLPVGTTKLPVKATTFPSIHLRADGVFQGAGKLKLEWWADANGTQTLGNDQWHVNNASNVTLFMPAQGPFFQVSFTVTSAGSFIGNLYASGTFISVPHIVYPVTDDDITAANKTVAAGATDTYPIAWVRNGLATFYGEPDAAAGGHLQFQLVKRDELGTLLGTLLDIGQPTGPFSQLVAMTDDNIMAITVTNTDAVAHNYAVALTPA